MTPFPGTILLESDDPTSAMQAATTLRRQGQSVTVTAGIRCVYAVRADWDRSYLAWRRTFSAWLLERLGVRS